VTIYIAIIFDTSGPSLRVGPFDLDVELFETLEDLEKRAPIAFKLYEYTDGKLTVLERKPVYKTVMKEVQEVDSYTIESAAVAHG
jgi:hypothetical protein